MQKSAKEIELELLAIEKVLYQKPELYVNQKYNY